MQIIEVTEWGVRSAVLRLQRPHTPLRFILFPMVHLATAEFYAAVEARLRECQLLVVEGIQGRSASARALTRSYRLLPHKGSLGMVVQDIDYEALGIPVVCPDMTGDQMDRGWRGLPWSQRTMFALLVPLFVGWMLLFGSRRVLAAHLAQDDLPSDEDLAIAEQFPKLEELIVDQRDRMLLDALIEIHEQRAGERIDVGVVYGAAHIPAVVHGMRQRYRYVARSGEWLNLFDL